MFTVYLYRRRNCVKIKKAANDILKPSMLYKKGGTAPHNTFFLLKPPGYSNKNILRLLHTRLKYSNLNFKIMARESVKILQGKLDVESLISQLNAALAEEWLAYYQYWVGALVVEGAMRADVQREFEEHAEEERRHAQLLADRIIELEGVPVLDPKQWFELARCKYDAPQGFDSVSLLKDNVASERCAILRYQEIADFTNGKDFTTCDIAKHILAEEEEHEQDLQDYLTDIARMKKSFLEK